MDVNHHVYLLTLCFREASNDVFQAISQEAVLLVGSIISSEDTRQKILIHCGNNMCVWATREAVRIQDRR